MRTLGPQARRVYDALHQQIIRCEYAPGSRMASHSSIARDFGVALMTARQALEKLESDGLIASRHGRGTFICDGLTTRILIVAHDRALSRLMCDAVTHAGCHAVEAAGPDEAVQALVDDMTIRILVTDARVPLLHNGIEFIRTVHRRWPNVALAMVTGSIEDLSKIQDIFGRPIPVLNKPIKPDQIGTLLRLTLNRIPVDNRGTDLGASGVIAPCQ